MLGREGDDGGGRMRRWGVGGRGMGDGAGARPRESWECMRNTYSSVQYQVHPSRHQSQVNTIHRSLLVAG